MNNGAIILAGSFVVTALVTCAAVGLIILVYLIYSKLSSNKSEEEKEETPVYKF